MIYANDGSRTYYHFNAHGDVVVLTNESGTKTKSYSYNAFGVEYNEATLDSNPFRYCGEYYDKETKTIYLRARYYNPTQGRFTQEDPIRDGYNWYAYCDSNPIVFVDPKGLASQSKFLSTLYKIFVNPIVSAYNAIEFEVGVGEGIGSSLLDSGARIYTDTTVMFDNGQWHTGHVAVAEAGSGPVSVGESYVHYSEKDGEKVRCIGDHAYEKRTYTNVKNCYISEECSSVSYGCVAVKNNGAFCVGAGGSLHFLIGGHINISFNVSEYWKGVFYKNND